MKKILMVVASVATMSLSSFGQGTFSMIWYDGANGITVDPLHNQHQTGWFVGSEYSAQAYMGAAGAQEGSLSGIAATLSAFDLTGATAAGALASNGAGQLYNATAVVTALPLGNTAIQIRAWFNGGLYATYEAALAAGANTGKSSVMTINLKANTDPTAQNLTDIGMQSFTVGAAVPEPSTIALAGLGAASLLMFRRRK